MNNQSIEMQTHLQQGLAHLKIEAAPEMLLKCVQFYEYLLEVNKVMNLTRITEPIDVAVKHFADSFTVYDTQSFPVACRVIDVGSGAGFPGIPLVLLRPDIKMTLADSLRKRTQFLSEACNRIGLKDIEVVQSRAEDLGQNRNYREAFDVVLARAVAPLNVLVELCLPLLKVGGVFFAMKGPRAADEVEEAQKAISILGGGKIVMNTKQLPLTEEGRVIIRIEKNRLTPSLYPRKAGIPERQPLK